MTRRPVDEFATIHSDITTSSDLFEALEAFRDSRWAFRGQGEDWQLAPTIDRHAIRPGVAEDFLMREFRRRAHHYIADLPGRDNDLEWLALMQHHGVPTRLLDWTRSFHVAAFFAAETSNSKNPSIRESPDPIRPFVIWAIDTESINSEAKTMLSLPPNSDLSSPEIFRGIYWPQPPDDLYTVIAVQPYRMNECLTIQQGLFLCANHVLNFRSCLPGLLHHANKRGAESRQWLHKLIVPADARAEVLSFLTRINITAATLYPGLDGFCRSLQVAVQLQERDKWPGLSMESDRENWVKGA